MNDSNKNITDFSQIEPGHLEVSSVLFSLTLVATFGAFTRYVLKQLQLPIPYRAVLLISGVIFGVVAAFIPPAYDYVHYISNIDMRIVSHTLLPVLIFESAISIDFHIFMRSFVQCAILSVFGLLITAFLIAVFAIVSFPYQWDLKTGLLFGFVLSTTDPTSVLPFLRDIGSSKILITFLEGESLITDGSAIVGFHVCLELLRNTTTTSGHEIDTPVYLFIFDILKKIFAAPLFGYITGAATVFCLARVFKDEVIEITITLCSAYLTYTISDDLLGISGVISVGSLALMICAHKETINPEIEIFVLTFWEMLSYLSQTAVFVAVGLVIMEKPNLKMYGLETGFFIFATYVAVFFIRFFVIFLLRPFLSRLGYGMRYKSAVVIGWAGVKGTVSLVLVLTVITKDNSIDEYLKHNMLCLVTGTVALTLLVNSTTIKFVLRRLGMDRISAERQSHMANAIRHLHECQENSIHVQKKIHLYAHVDWDYVRNYTRIDNPYKRHNIKSLYTASLEAEHQYGGLSPQKVQLTEKEMKEKENDCRLDIISAHKVIYWRLFQEGLLATKEVSFLLSLAEYAADEPYGYINVKNLKEKWEISKMWLNLERCLQFPKEDHPVVIRSNCRRVTHYIITRRAYESLIMIILVLNIVVIVNALLSAKDIAGHYWPQIFYNVLFICVYLLDTMLKVTGLTWMVFWRNNNNKMDISVNMLAFVESITEFVYVMVNDPITSDFVLIIQGIKLVRVLKFIRLIHLFRRLLLHIVMRHIHDKLFSAFNIGCAYYAGETEILRLLDEIIDEPSIAEKTQNICEQNILEINKQLARFKETYPDTAVAVTTRHATRSTLNEIRQQINYLQLAGLIEDIIHESLIEICEEKIKRLYHSPTKLKSHTPDDILKGIEWISGDNELFSFLQKRFELVLFKRDEMITKYGDIPKGIRIITMGTIKVTGVIVNDANGGLPNTDSFHWFSSTRYVEDYLTVGSVLGELGFLTEKPYLTVATCECQVQVISISEEILREAVTIFDQFDRSLLSRMWRSCLLRIGRRVFARSGYYQGWELQNIIRRMDSAYIPNIEKCMWYNITAEMENIALLQGLATDPEAKKDYIAPCHIPRNIGSLSFQIDAMYNPIILIIGTANAEAARAIDLHPPVSGQRPSITDTRMNLARVIRSYSFQKSSILHRQESILSIEHIRRKSEQSGKEASTEKY